MSHGPVDVFAAKAGKILLVQVKSGSARASKEELELLKAYALAFNADAQVWSFKKRGNLQKVTVSRRIVAVPIIQPSPVIAIENPALSS